MTTATIDVDERRHLQAAADETLPPLQSVVVHGYRRAFRMAGKGPAIVLLHGIGDNSESWAEVMAELSKDHLVIAPDFLGHGASDKPRADYSIGGFANGMRDLLSVLQIKSATFVGHSLGAGVAMQFAYQYPEKCERLILVGAGGVSRDVHIALRAAALPGTPLTLSLLKSRKVTQAVRAVVKGMQVLNTDIGRDAVDLLRVLESLPDLTSRRAFTRTLRAVVDVRGQVVTMLDRCYLSVGMPTLLVWGSRDAVIPVHHARIANVAMPGSRLEIYDGAGHFPHHSDPERFVASVREFIATTEPAKWDLTRWRQLMQHGAADPAFEAVRERLSATPA